MQSSYQLDDHTQADGSIWVTEIHVDDHGRTHKFPYLAPASWGPAEYTAKMNARVPSILERMKDSEFKAILQGEWPLPPVYQTGAELAERFWRAVKRNYLSNEKNRQTFLFWWLEERLLAGDFTDAAARNSFNSYFNKTLNSSQWTNLRNTRIKPAHDRWVAEQAESPL